MKKVSPVTVKTTLLKFTFTDEKGHEKVRAKVTYTFLDYKNSEKVVGILEVTSICDDIYLEEMSDGYVLPVVRNAKFESQNFFLVKGQHTYWMGSISFHKALKIAQNETTLIGRFRNWVALIDFKN